VERQVQLGRQWAETNGYRYAADSFEDLGVSAYTGANLQEGSDLARFLRAVKDGEIERGSVLLIERFDRFSRQKRRVAQRLLEDIITAGVDVVTTHNGKRYTEEMIDNELGATLEIILGFQAAYEYSKTLSERVGRAWKTNRTKVAEGEWKRTTKIPSWLRLVDQDGNPADHKTGEFVVVEEKAEVVREFFTRYADGEPTSAIARDFRERGVPTLSGRGNWTGPLIYGLVREVSPYGTLLIGEGSKKTGNRRIVDQITDYYPRVVDEDTQRRVKLRIERGRGPVKVKAKGETRGRLVGVLRSPEGNRVKAKRNNRSISYVDYITNKYIGAVSVVDQVLIDEWDKVAEALGVETTEEAEAIEAAEVVPLVELLEDLERRREEKPSPALDRMILGAEADLEQARLSLQEAQAKARVSGAVPAEIALLSVPEANQWIRKVVETARVYREGRGKDAKVALNLRLKNGLLVSLGDASVGFEAHPEA
jgi:DNA invertase Pin-like site-specific DNA recombinase